MSSTTIQSQSPLPWTTDAMIDLIIDAIQDVKGKNIVKLDLRKLKERPTDFFIICQGDSIVQVRAIADRVRMKVRDQTGVRPGHLEGGTNSIWVLVDYFDVVVHIFYPETREFYDLETLWSDADITTYPDL
ncbi:MAG: ribosome silencing factor [Saprospiraceae bacterium]